jgi:branched-chain amino acid transport system permease protein
VACAIGIAAGVVAALIIGLPAVRIQGLYLAVTTLAFGYAMQGYLLNTHYTVGRHLLPNTLRATVNRPLLYGRIDLENGRAFYYVCLALLAVTVAAAYAFRRNRSGRVLIAARDNQRAAPAYGINLVRTRLAAFAVSGGMAGLAGVLITYLQHQVSPASFGVFASVGVFLATVIGGLTSVGFAVTGAVVFEFVQLFGPRYYRFLGKDMISVMPLLLTGPLLILNLYFYPGGSAEAGYQERDRFLRWVARRHDIVVPSLVADKRVEEEEHQREEVIIEQAERHVEAGPPPLTCPVCGVALTLEEALMHDHLRAEAGRGRRARAHR